MTGPGGMEIYNVYLDLRDHPLPVVPAALRPVLSTILPIHPRLQHHLNRRVWIRIDQPKRLAAPLKRIMEEMDSSAPGALEIVQHSFQIFLIDVCRAARRHGLVPSRALSKRIPGWVENLRQDLDREFAAPHTLRGLAKTSRRQRGLSLPGI